MQLLNAYQATTERWYVSVQNDDGRIAELKYAARPTQQQAFADFTALFNPPTTAVTAEDGTVLNLPYAHALSLSLTPAQRTALQTAKGTIDTFINRVTGLLPDDRDSLARLRAACSFLDWMFSIDDRLT